MIKKLAVKLSNWPNEDRAIASQGVIAPQERKNVGCSERRTEIKQRRHRRKRMQHYKGRLKKATVSEKAVIADKLRLLTPGAEVLIEAWNLEER